MRARGAPSFPTRPRDLPARAAGARRARGGAAVRARRHRDRRPPRPAAARRARPRRHRARRARSRSSTSSPTGRRRSSRARRARAGTSGRRASRRRRSGSRSRSGSCSLVVLRDRSPSRCSRRSAAHGQSGDYALTYFRIAAIGLPAALIALAGQGYLRGVSNLRRPLEIVVVANARERRARAPLRLRLPLGHRGLGGRDGDRAGRDGRRLRRRAAAAARGRRKRPSLREMRPMLRVGRQIFVRTAALYASFLVAASVLRAHGRRAARRAPDRIPALLLPRARSSTRSRSPAR